MNVEAKPKRLSLSIVFISCQTYETSVSYDFSNSWANRRVAFCFQLWNRPLTLKVLGCFHPPSREVFG